MIRQLEFYCMDCHTKTIFKQVDKYENRDVKIACVDCGYVKVLTKNLYNHLIKE